MKVVTLHEIFKQNALCLAKRLNTVVSATIDEPILYVVFGAHQNPLLLIELQKKCKCQYLILNSEHYSSDYFRNKYYLKLLPAAVLSELTINKCLSKKRSYEFL